MTANNSTGAGVDQQRERDRPDPCSGGTEARERALAAEGCPHAVWPMICLRCDVRDAVPHEAVEKIPFQRDPGIGRSPDVNLSAAVTEAYIQRDRAEKAEARVREATDLLKIARAALGRADGMLKTDIENWLERGER